MYCIRYIGLCICIHHQDGSRVGIRRLNKIYNLTKKQRMKQSSDMRDIVFFSFYLVKCSFFLYFVLPDWWIKLRVKCIIGILHYEQVAENLTELFGNGFCPGPIKQ